MLLANLAVHICGSYISVWLWNMDAIRKGRIQTRWLLYSYACLLYTSDAADEEDSVDLGGRRIIKKKK